MSELKDQLFETIAKIEDFNFDQQVADVFDDMIRRSVPFYDEVQRMAVEIAVSFLQSGGDFFDIGCSTGTTICNIASILPSSLNTKFTGIEPSAAMLGRASQKVSSFGDRVKLVKSEVQDVTTLHNAQVVTMLYTLQFIRPLERLDVLRKIRHSIKPDGCLILAEKILADEGFVRRLFIDTYHNYKLDKGYSETEISKKREALENVLIPFKNRENIKLLHDAGFASVELAFRWYNFALYIASPD